MLGFSPMLCVVAGCATASHPSPGSNALRIRQPEIELLGFPGCPNTPELRDNLKAALASMGKGWTFTDTDQEQSRSSDPRRGWPAPTILVNGRDLFGMPAPTASGGMGCRIYPGGVPNAGAITDAIKETIERSSNPTKERER
jgi:hypothetical protein